MINDEKEFFDYYDFLGVPPAAPPNLVYLAILKIENSLKRNLEKFTNNNEDVIDVKLKIAEIYEILLSEEDRRFEYEKIWQSYYFPRDELQTNIQSMKLNSANSTLLRTGLKIKSPLIKKEEKKLTIFDYEYDFSYLIMCDRPKERNVFFLDTKEEIKLPPYSDIITFKENRFFLSTKGEIKVSISNDALGKYIICSKASKEIPLHIGDRMEFESGTRLILRGFYTKLQASIKSEKKWGIHLAQENVIMPLEVDKNYIFGRNTSDVRSLSFDQDLFCFINIGRRERSISRQNFQLFYHNGKWYLQDLGSRYGTMLDFNNHNKFETLIGGSIMELENGYIRLGYDKSYTLEVNEIDKLEKREVLNLTKDEEMTIYDIPLL